MILKNLLLLVVLCSLQGSRGGSSQTVMTDGESDLELVKSEKKTKIENESYKNININIIFTLI